MTKIPDPIMDELQKHDVQYEVVNKSKHATLYVEGRIACVLSYGAKTKDRTMKNAVSRIRRMIRSL